MKVLSLLLIFFISSTDFFNVYGAHQPGGSSLPKHQRWHYPWTWEHGAINYTHRVLDSNIYVPNEEESLQLFFNSIKFPKKVTGQPTASSATATAAAALVYATTTNPRDKSSAAVSPEHFVSTIEQVLTKNEQARAQKRAENEKAIAQRQAILAQAQKAANDFQKGLDPTVKPFIKVEVSEPYKQAPSDCLDTRLGLRYQLLADDHNDKERYKQLTKIRSLIQSGTLSSQKDLKQAQQNLQQLKEYDYSHELRTKQFFEESEENDVDITRLNIEKERPVKNIHPPVNSCAVS